MEKSRIFFGITILFFSTCLFSQGNGNGNSNGNAGGAAALASDVEALQEDVATLFSLLTADSPVALIADCTGGNAGALQDSVDISPPVGSHITVIGNCGSTSIVGKSNITIDGQGTGSITADDGGASVAALYIESSTQTQVTGLSIDANGNSSALAAWDSVVFLYDSDFSGASGPTVHIDRGASAIIGDLTINGLLQISTNSSVISDNILDISNPDNTALLVINNSTFEQVSGTVSVTGTVEGLRSGTIFFTNGSVEEDGSLNDGLAVLIARGSNLSIDSGSGSSFSLAGSIQAFSSSNFDALSSGGVVDVSGDSMLIQRNSSTTLFSLAGSGLVTIDIADIRVTQSAVLDFLFSSIANVPAVTLELGGGLRAFSGVAPLTASCDGSHWILSNFISCL